ncbi:MAG: 4Fe-4S ferredoxin [Thalassobius sp.]|nr:4Fe-4S ferredoxin [Thalassovita sp.]
MKLIKTTGLILFVAGFITFNYTFFLSDYELTGEIVSEQIPEGLQESFSKEASSIIDHTTSSSFQFIAELDKAFETINAQVLNAYAVSDTELDELLNTSGKDGQYVLTEEVVKSVFDSDDEATAFKQKTIIDYGSWLFGTTYSSKDDLNNNLSGVVDNIRKYGIINQKGFDRYKIKDLKTSITKGATKSPVKDNPWLFILLTYGLCIIGASMYILPKLNEGKPGIKNNGVFKSAMHNKGWLGILTGTYLILFYIFLYYYPEYMLNWIIMVDPVSILLKGSDGGRFFLYGFIYTLSILVMGVRMIIKYRHSKYQIVRTFSVMFFQTAFAFLIPEILLRLNQPYYDFKNIWPLDYDFFFDNELSTLVSNGSLGIFMLGWGIALIAIGVPVFVYFFGKRWYCSWVCGCGGLAETLGDPYRQLSDKSLKAWKIERYSIHGVLVFAVVMTIGVLYTYFSGSGSLLGINTYTIRETYGAWIGAGFAGVVGTGFYPLMGNRVWCRFGCPLAAYLGIVQRFKSRFRITTNGGQCISCGNCSTYCEMGIDVRWYAQRGQNIVRSSCVGCGVCSAVCPRGVLNLENASEGNRTSTPIVITGREVKAVNS